MKGTEVEASSSAPDPEPAAPTVELVGFTPSFKTEGASAPSVVDAAAAAQRRKTRRIWTGAVVLVLILTITIGPVIYRAAKADRAASLARSAEIEIAKNQMDEAIATIRSAYLMAPNDPEVLRGMAKTLSALSAPSAMNYWNWVLNSRGATMEDRREAAECALKLGLYNQAGVIISGLLHDDDHSAPNLLMAGRYYALCGATSEAMSFANRAVAADSNDQPAVIFLAAQELASVPLHEAGIRSLLQVAHRNDPFALLALERLTQDPNLTPEQTRETLELVQAFPDGGEVQRIMALMLQLRLDPAHHDELLDQAVKAHAHASTDDLRQFGNWLNSAGDSKWVFNVIPQEQIFLNKDLFLIYLDALGAEKKWNEMTDLLTHRPLPLETPYVELYLYRCARELGDTEAADLHWRSAQVAASHSPRQSLYLASYAEKLGDNDRAEAIYRSLTGDLLAGRSAYLGLVRLSQKKDTATVRDLLDQMTARWPQDEAIANDDIYYNLLLNVRVREMCRRAVELAKADVYSAPHLTDVALAYLKLQAPAQAFKVFHYGHIQWASAAPATETVYAATLKATGQDEAAARVVSYINRKNLRPEEQALIENIP